jgi:negative regulator of sigma E activity
MDNENLKRIADALEEILRLVKKDMERYENRKDIK